MNRREEWERVLEILRGMMGSASNWNIIHKRESLTPCTKNYAMQNIIRKNAMHTHPRQPPSRFNAKMHCNLFSFFPFENSVVVMQILKWTRSFSLSHSTSTRSEIKTEARKKINKIGHTHKCRNVQSPKKAAAKSKCES